MSVWGESRWETLGIGSAVRYKLRRVCQKQVRPLPESECAMFYELEPKTPAKDIKIRARDKRVKDTSTQKRAGAAKSRNKPKITKVG